MTTRDIGFFQLPFGLYMIHASLLIESSVIPIMGSLFLIISFVLIFFEPVKSLYFWFVRIVLMSFGRHIQLAPTDVKQIWFSRHGGLSALEYRRHLVLAPYKDEKSRTFTFKSRALWIPAKYFVNTPFPKPKKIGFPPLVDAYFLPFCPEIHYVDVSFLGSEYFKEIKYHHESDKQNQSGLRKLMGYFPILLPHLIIFAVYLEFVL